jgi:hypothetical protein
MSNTKRNPYYYPIGIFSLIALPIVLLFYSWDNPLLRERCMDMFAEVKGLDRDMVYVDKYYFRITNEDFPNSANISGLINLCAKQDSIHRPHGRIILNISRDLLYQNYITLLERLHSINHYVVYIELWGKDHEFNVIYKYKDWLDSYSSYRVNRKDYEFEYADLYEKVKLLVQRDTPYKYLYLAQIFNTTPLLWLIMIGWLLILWINIIRIIQFHKMCRLTNASSSAGRHK